MRAPHSIKRKNSRSAHYKQKKVTYTCVYSAQ